MSEPLRIVMVGGVPESLERFRGPLLSRLVALGHEVTALAGSERGDVSRRLAERGVVFESYRLQRTGTGLLADLGTLRDLRERFRRIEPDLVLAYTAKPVIWGGLAARRTGVPRFVALITGLGQQFSAQTRRQRALGRLLGALYRLSLRRAEVVFFQNEDDRAHFVGAGWVPHQRTEVVHGSGIDLAAWPPHALPTGSPRVLCVARLLAAKGIREFAAAARRVRAQRPDVRFELVGIPETGHEAIGLDEVAEWAYEGVLDFRERIDDVGAAMRDATLFVLPSYYGEGVPRTILEAMATGRPVITTDHVGCRDAVVQGETGVLVPPRDAEALSAAILNLIDDPERIARMAAAGRRRAETRYEVERVNDAIIERLGFGPPHATTPERTASSASVVERAHALREM